MKFLRGLNLQNTSNINQKWDSRYYSIMGLMCWTLGLGNIWKFPILMAYNQGAYMFPFVLSTIFVSIPLTYMEMAIGQFSSSGPISVWNMCLFWQGSGYACIFLLICLILHYGTLGSYLLYYLIQCFNPILPWTECNPHWALENCLTFATNISVRFACLSNHSEEYCEHMPWQNSAAHYWTFQVLQTLHTEDWGDLRWELIMCNIASSIIILFCLRNGLNSLQKYVTFFIVVPFVEQAILLFVCLIHPGSIRGIDYFVKQNFFKLEGLKTWHIPIEQVLCSVGVGLGGLIVHGSSNNFRHSIHLDAIIINVVDLCYSIMFGFLSFTSLGVLSYSIEMSMEDVVQLPDTLLFVRLPLSLLYWPGIPHVWNILFFSSVYLSALRSQIFMIGTLMSAICSVFPNAQTYYTLSTGVVCLFLVVLNLPYFLQFGPILLDYVSDLCTASMVLLVIFLEVFGVMWLYGMNNFVDDLHFMLGFRASTFWHFCWIICPFILFFCFVASCYESSISPSSEFFTQFEVVYIVQCIIFSTPFLLVTIFAVNYFFKREDTKCNKLLRPSPKWGPVDPTLYKSRDMFSSHSMTKEYMYRQNRVKSRRFQPEIPINLEENADGLL